MKKTLKRFKIVYIDVYIYQMFSYKEFNKIKTNYKINKSEVSKGKTCYFIEESSKVIHKSYLFSKVFLLKSINKRGPVIGNCSTLKSHRGLSIYPYVINKIAKDVLENNNKPVYIIVDKNNLSSIRGIEKAGFSKLASIVAKRWLWFYRNKQITYFNT